jgi:hypothetical protein
MLTKQLIFRRQAQAPESFEVFHNPPIGRRLVMNYIDISSSYSNGTQLSSGYMSQPSGNMLPQNPMGYGNFCL